MITYPITFQGSAAATEGIKTRWSTQTPATSLQCSIPAEFEGSGDFASPEDYFLLAVMNCFVATFKVYAAYSKFSFRDLKVSGTLTVDKNDEGKPCMQEVMMHIKLTGVANTARAQTLIDKTLANGFILQSVKSKIVTSVSFEE